MRRPRIAERYGLSPGPGLAEVLGGRVSVADALQGIPAGDSGDDGDFTDAATQRLQTLVAGTPTADSWVLMQSGVMDGALGCCSSATTWSSWTPRRSPTSRTRCRCSAASTA